MILPSILGAATVLAGLLTLQVAVTPAPATTGTSTTGPLAASAAALGTAFQDLCQETGCDADALTRAIGAGAAAMSEAELRAALAAQTDLLARMTSAASTAGGEGAPPRALAAERRIAELYAATLAGRTGDL
ncbi:hypothetical protein [Jannaschia formosa]|uniref:hypothetical protein n=1 Tax=Jannaschia formosa TaxID=2259592 RepID=UPI000E1BAF17|nr:hypothetical protein [Jannaschia formosa]TFL19008.1 hypothetical protein DR046_06235 [Jannaschia formosa]